MSNFEDKSPTQRIRPPILFDVVLIDVPPANRMRVIDAMRHNDYYPNLSLMDAMVLVFRLPSVVMHCCELKDAVILEMIFEIQGAIVNVRAAKHCGEAILYKKPDDGDTKQLTDTELSDDGNTKPQALTQSADDSITKKPIGTQPTDVTLSKKPIAIPPPHKRDTKPLADTHLSDDDDTEPLTDLHL